MRWSLPMYITAHYAGYTTDNAYENIDKTRKKIDEIICKLRNSYDTILVKNTLYMDL